MKEQNLFIPFNLPLYARASLKILALMTYNCFGLSSMEEENMSVILIKNATNQGSPQDFQF